MSKRAPVAVFVDGSEADEDAYHIAKRYFSQITTSVNGHEYICEDNVVFVFENFETGSFRDLRKYRGISTHALKVLYDNDHAKSLPKLKASRPIYCFSMVDMTFVLDGFPMHSVRRAVDLIHYMGGHVKENYAPDLRLIAKDTQGQPYRLAVSLGHQVLSMKWLEECWKRRDDMDFVVSDKDLMNQFCLKCFGGLCLYFLGFDGPELQELRDKTRENGGIVVGKPEDATHIVISQDAISKTSRADLQTKHHAPSDAHFVTLQWFWESIHHEFCNREELFSVFKDELRRGRKRRSDHQDRKAKSRRSELPSNGDLDGPRQSGRISMSKSGSNPTIRDKRYYVCMEMLQTEQNYINCLQLIVSLFKEPLERMIVEFENKENHQRPLILSKQQITVIFGKIQPILEVHRTIQTELFALMQIWDNHYDNVCIGKVWADREEELKKVYPPYVTSYDEVREMLEQCLTEIPKFHTFVKLAESDPKCKSLKITLKDMLIKPVQRLPSVVLLLNELIKRTDKSHKDIPSLGLAVKRVSHVLELTNKHLKQTETYEQFLSICNQIHDFPDELVNSSRTFVMQAVVIGLDGDEFFRNYKGRNITLFMFNDFVVFAKNRTLSSLNTSINPSIYASPHGTLSRQRSFLGFRPKKKYRLLSMHRIPDFRLIRYANEIVTVKIRVEEGDYLFVAQPDGETTMKALVDFFTRLCQLSLQLCGKAPVMEKLTDEVMENMKQTSSEDYEVIGRAMARRTPSHTGSIRRQSTLRRAVSHVSLGISNGLSRFASRSHLGFINENFGD